MSERPARDRMLCDGSGGTVVSVSRGALPIDGGGPPAAERPSVLADRCPELSAADWAGHLVAVLFAGGGPLKIELAARTLGVPPASLEDVVRFLQRQPPLGLRVQRSGDELELVTDPASARYVEALLGLDRPTRLSRAALETLAIVAYRQPVTRGEIESIRGVSSDSAIATLVNRGLIAEVGRRESVGRPVLYGTTGEFLQYLGIDSLESLPPLPQ